MSTHWDLVCTTCSASACIDWNHGEGELLAFLRDDGVAKVAAVASIDLAPRGYHKLVVGIGPAPSGNATDLGSFCLKHLGHTIVVRNEYGVDSGKCGRSYSCAYCKASHQCTLQVGHAGGHETELT